MLGQERKYSAIHQLAQSRREYGPSEGAQLLRGLRIAAERTQREEFNKIFTAAVQLTLPFDSNAGS